MLRWTTAVRSALALVAVSACPIGIAGQMDPQMVWPLCGRITENPPAGWQANDGCPLPRAGDPQFSDAPLSATYGPRWLLSENDRYDFHRGIDIATPTGTPFFAVADGVVRIAGEHSAYTDPLVQLRHFRPGYASCSVVGCYHSLYLHISDWVVAQDEVVTKGQLLGYTGESASGFQHLHFEIRDAPDFDVYSSWSRDARHPLGPLPYAEAVSGTLTFESVDDSDPDAIKAELRLVTPRYDFLRMEVFVFEPVPALVDQPGNAPDANGYHVLPAFWDMETANFQYSHKDSSTYPWSSFATCPYASEHGSAYDANVHMDAQHPGNYQEGLFNGIHVTTGKYWPGDYEISVEFLHLTGPAGCLEGKAVFASGDVLTALWGHCVAPPARWWRWATGLP